MKRLPKQLTQKPSSESSPPNDPTSSVEAWFATRHWSPFAFQRQAWSEYLAGKSGLIHSSTGTGKTYAAFFGPLLEVMAEPPATSPPPIRVLWLTPLRALSNDTVMSLELPLASLGLNWDVGIRTGDTSSAIRNRQKKRFPSVLVTTPESLALQLTYPESREKFVELRCVIVDEWHELLASKRGVLTELGLARLRSFRPDLRVWGLSATLGNLDVALAALMGASRSGSVIQGHMPKTVIIDSIVPPRLERFPWAGHLGLNLLPQVLAAIEEGKTSLVFTNTRSQTEIWYQAILEARPQWAGQIALHHGSLDRQARDWVEDQLRAGTLRCVVCTSSLDLGVDFSPVDRIIQVGSPKGVARLLQRAGRSGHQPGAISRVTCVPTNTFELVEVAAARDAAAANAIEGREPFPEPLDVLAQHAVSSALAGGFKADELLAEVRTTYAYQNLTEPVWNWVLDFVTRGGEALRAYPEYRRVTVEDGVYTVPDGKIARRHRMSIGTIVSDASVQVRYLRGGKLGTVEEYFAAKLNPGDRFNFAGRVLEFVRMQDMTVWVRRSARAANTTPRWMGGRMPLSSELASAVRSQLDDAGRGKYLSIEMQAVKVVLDVQARWSKIPAANELLVERLETREGSHLFIYPFEGRLTHEGLAALAAYRLSRLRPQTFSLSVNDYGFELLSPDPIEVDEQRLLELFRLGGLSEHLLESLNAAELAKRQFREVARIAGLISTGPPNASRSSKQLQASSSLFYTVFREYDPGNLLLHQAQREVLDRQFELTRLNRALARIAASRLVIVEPPRPTPLGFGLLVQRLRESLSSEKLADRVERLAADLERRATAESR